MTNPLDLSIDWLADAPLTPEQRQAWNRMRAELVDMREKMRALENKIRTLEQTPEEPHTVLTRPEFNREVARMLAFDERYGGVSSVLYFDIENLEEVTARYGKSVTNAAIREISNVLMRRVRGSDIVGRLAPDEFGILLARCDNPSAWKKGEQLCGFLREALREVHSCQLDLAISYGAYTFQDNRDLATGLKEAAQMVTKAHTGS
ncbi:MAG: GGDEF domain-containing protein [Alphaproteobacteria bacterium]|nr:GGDEF domain-containing protein [Alphaproteobacteria bacterium]